MQTCLQLVDAFGAIFRQYALAQQTDQSLSDDVSLLIGYLLRMSAAMSDVAEEFLATLDPSDPSYATRLAGLRRMQLGNQQLVQGALLGLSVERRFYSNDASARLAAIVAETYPTLSVHFPPETRQDFETSLNRIALNDPDMRVRDALANYAAIPSAK